MSLTMIVSLYVIVTESAEHRKWKILGVAFSPFLIFLFFIFCGFWPWVAFSSLLITQVLLEILPSFRIRVSEWAFHSLSFLFDFLEEFEDFGQLIFFLKRIGPYLEMHHSKAFLEEFWYCLSKFLRKRLIDNWASINTFLDKIKAVSICQKN